MSSFHLLASAVITCAFVSCASPPADQYDTVPPTPTAQVNDPVTPPANPTYDTPAAYQDVAAVPTAPASASNPNIPATAPVRVPSRVPSNGAAIIHTVVAGDTLSGISAKYKVPAAAIKQANGMTKDIVVLGKKMAIPPAR